MRISAGETWRLNLSILPLTTEPTNTCARARCDDHDGVPLNQARFAAVAAKLATATQRAGD